MSLILEVWLYPLYRPQGQTKGHLFGVQKKAVKYGGVAAHNKDCKSQMYDLIRKSRDYVYGIWQYKIISIKRAIWEEK